MVQQNYSFVVVRAFRSIGQVDTNAPTTIQNAWAANMDSVDVYMFPCPKCSASPRDQISTMLNFLAEAGVFYGMIWIDVEGSQYWTADTAWNAAWFGKLLGALQDFNATVGVYTSIRQWGPIMGNSTAGSVFPLWYARYDNKPDFSDFVPFGGWTVPSVKQFQGDQIICNASVDVNFYPG